jgi:hypothetical protein
VSGWQQIETRIAEQRQALLNHNVYSLIEDIEGVRIFMQSHVFAVWDFMSLLKVLQRELCCTSIPWTPPADPNLARMINEIVLAEESDEDEQGNFASHYDLYRSAMLQAKANTQPADEFLERIRSGESLSAALNSSDIPEAAKKFVQQSFAVIETGHLPSIAAAFTFGREDLLPDVFTQVIAGVNRSSAAQLSEFTYYLDRHVSLDGDEHGPMAKKLVMALCGENEQNWKLAEEAVVACLQSRLDLWDAMSIEIKERVQKV